MSDKDSYDDSDLQEFDLDDPLLGPPDAIAEPPVDPQLEYLPTDRLSWENFERLLVRVAQDVHGLRNVRRFGTSGQAQKGLDVIGINSDDMAEGIQSKRRKTFTKSHLDDAVDKYTESTFRFSFARLAIGVRIELTIADATGEWNELLHKARTATRRDLGALTLARYARHTMWLGNFVEANQAWAEAINHACLAHRHEDAAEWLYSQRFVMNRHVAVIQDEWHPVARSLSDLPSRPRLVTSASTSRENALAACITTESVLPLYICAATCVMRSGRAASTTRLMRACCSAIYMPTRTNRILPRAS